jgi:hypothetical protein
MRRNMAAVDALYLQEVSMWLPRPEFDFFAERAAASSSFAVQLMGEYRELLQIRRRHVLLWYHCCTTCC